MAVLLLIGGLTAFAIGRGDSTGEAVDASGTPANTDGYAVVVGDADAPLTMKFYEDPQCPICQQFEAAVGEQVQTAIADGKVQVAYHVVSFLDDASENEYSSRAANALYVVADAAGPDVFAKYHSLLFENQPAEGTAGPDDDQLIAWAVEAGADEATSARASRTRSSSSSSPTPPTRCPRTASTAPRASSSTTRCSPTPAPR